MYRGCLDVKGHKTPGCILHRGNNSLDVGSRYEGAFHQSVVNNKGFQLSASEVGGLNVFHFLNSYPRYACIMGFLWDLALSLESLSDNQGFTG